jgi:RND family efflux transporter MFP subunit
MAFDENSLAGLKIDRSARPASRLGPPPWLLIVIALLVMGGGVAWWSMHGRAIPVEVATVAAASAGTESRGAAVLDASGYVVARREATVSSKVTGKVAEVFVEEGMAVRQSQILARLDDSSLQPQLELEKTQLHARQAEREETAVRLAEAERNLGRVRSLRAQSLVSAADLDASQAEVDATRARLAALSSAIDVAAASVRVYEQQLSELAVRAPFDGIIVSKDAQPGEMVSPVSAGGGFTRTGIATLVDMSSREIEVDVNEAYINRVSDGQRTEATLDAYPDWHIPSHVINIVPTADRQKATVRVRIAFNELDPRILPNMGVKVSFLDAAAPAGAAGAARPAVLVPATAVALEGATSYVWRLKGATVEHIAVRTGREQGGQIELLSGISAGDTVVVRPVAGLAPGVAVAPTRSQGEMHP